MDQSNSKNYRDSEKFYFSKIENYFQDSSGSFTEKMHAFCRYTPRQSLASFLIRSEIFKEIIDVHGSICDFGVYRGSSFFAWQQLSAIYEPYNHTRKIIGFDSFDGFSEIGKFDGNQSDEEIPLKKVGGMAFSGADEMRNGIDLLDLNRPVGHVPKSSIVTGALPESFDSYLDKHPETVVSLANFGLGLYGPTVKLMQQIKPRLTVGSIVVLEEINQAIWPGETKALEEVFGLNNLSLKRMPYCPQISWFRFGS
ncbi:MAG: hypothetical protein RIA09_01480 [Hoeflea sp.]|uniref:hypothetical protein n=1 Tax=Hoeflea sp. TaxID=1940281 RepID=UPI0032EBBAA2